MCLSTQSKILHVLQEGTYERFGSEATLKSDVRIIAGTNQNLEQLILEKNFREDLYYRIKVITITLPPLCLRKEDLPDLTDYFIQKHSASLGRNRISI